MTNRIPFAAVLASLLLLAVACSDEATRPEVPDPDPDLSGTVTDAAGRPVADAAIGLVYKLDGVSLPGDAAKPATQIVYSLPEASHLRLVILDRAGALLRTVVDDQLPAGPHTYIWDGRDDDGDRVPAGMYRALAEVDGALNDDMSIFLYEFDPAAFLDAPNAVTNADGRFRIDRALIAVGDSLGAVPDESGGEPVWTRIRPELGVVAAIADSAGLHWVRVGIVWDANAVAGQDVTLALPAP